VRRNRWITAAICGMLLTGCGGTDPAEDPSAVTESPLEAPPSPGPEPESEPETAPPAEVDPEDLERRVEESQRRVELNQRLSDEIQRNVETRGSPEHVDGSCVRYAERYQRVAREDELIGRQLSILCPGQFERP
jgi:hypothetical protein